MVIEMFLARTDVNVDSKDRNGRTPLSFAAEQGHVSAVKLLLARNDIDTDSKDDDGRTPLSFAVKLQSQSHWIYDIFRIGHNPEGHRMVIEMFLARTDVNVDSKDRDGRTPLSFATEEWNASAAAAFNDIDVDLKDNAGRKPLSHAVRVCGCGELII
jgi:ankyrin repeat protein